MRKAKSPTRPASMLTIRKYLEGPLKSGVMPRDTPTVAKALQFSKKIQRAHGGLQGANQDGKAADPGAGDHHGNYAARHGALVDATAEEFHMIPAA